MSPSLVAENNSQGQMFGMSQTSPTRRSANTSHINWNRLQTAAVPNTAIPELRRSPAYQLTSISTQPTLVNALNGSSNLKRSAATPIVDTKAKPSKTTAVHSVGPQHPFVRYTDAISQRLVLHHPDAVEFWARCPLCHCLICCVDQKTSCYRSDAVEKHVEVLHAEKVWITSSQVNAEYMWGASNPISGGFDQLDMFVDDAKEAPDRKPQATDKESSPSTDPVERDVLRALALEAKTQFQFSTSQDIQPSHVHKRRRTIVPQCVAGSTAHARTKCTQTCYLKMIG
ncbi:hypothetical protein K450DRAFT_255548 [Umbelopsis ramanniana AG]|uniref:Uncharacterized protein n=1 Tax=Umbelopsis ramanniana AG TaxID=1314678 RepID=A0AAD5E5J0_UMBRA|nr:uncharacterized protein K450DRAFT_255548 [Umbelopsis ramanniana AG]KAI8576770.1 hypothetical protein K450DRAFT_255548 [Umbelopsis ramanniana AG]